MTRVLSELLGAREPMFRLSLATLENSTGRPSADIRLSTEIAGSMRQKLNELNLDATNTTGQELYATLGVRLHMDEARLAARIGDDMSELSVLLAKKLQSEVGKVSVFALKSTVSKKLLKANIPKKTMKLLGYRSADSLFKHETSASILAAAWLVENEQWAKKLLTGYAKLKAADFEMRAISIEAPHSKRWQCFSEAVIAEKKHNVLAFKEIGAVVLLPLPAQQPKYPALSTTVLAIHSINDVLAASSYLKLHQVRSQFGTIVKKIVMETPTLDATLLDQPVSWSMLQQYYSRFKSTVKADIFEPLVQADDMIWHGVEALLARIEPSLAFWEGTGHIGLLHDGKAVSCNILDNIMTHGNDISYAGRLTDYMRSELFTELQLRYLSHERVEQSLTGQFQQQLATEPVLA